MKYKLLLLLMLVAGVCQGQGVYKYKDVEVTASSTNGNVILNSLGNFELSDSLLSIQVMPTERGFMGLIITNKFDSPIKFRWRNCSASSMTTNYRATIDPSYGVDDKTTGIDIIYKKGVKVYTLDATQNGNPYGFGNTYYAFSKKPKDEEVDLILPFVINDTEKPYIINFKANLKK